MLSADVYAYTVARCRQTTINDLQDVDVLTVSTSYDDHLLVDLQHSDVHDYAICVLANFVGDCNSVDELQLVRINKSVVEGSAALVQTCSN